MKDFNFESWDPNKYLNDYFNDAPEFEDTIKFIIDNLKGKFYKRAIDVGCGPTVCYWSSVSNFCRHMDIADFKKSNLNVIKDWVYNKGKFNWTHFSRLALRYLGKSADAVSVKIYEEQTKMKLKNLYLCNAFQQPVFEGAESYDLVTTFYCADSISKNMTEWMLAMDNICSLITSNGSFMGAALEKCKFYCIDGIKYPCADLTKKDIENYLVSRNFSNINIKIGKEFYRGNKLKTNHNYANLIFFSADK